MPIYDTIAEFVQDFGEPQPASKVSAKEAEAYAGRLPAGLLRFWQEHGRGGYLDGRYWICDPAPFDAILKAIFLGDPEFSAADMTVYAYTAYGEIHVWHKRRRTISIDFLFNDIFCPPETAYQDRETKEFFPEDFSIGIALSSFADFSDEIDDEGEDLFPQALSRLGRLKPGEVYGFFPPPTFGGTSNVAALRRTPAIEYISFLAQVSELQFTRLTDPSPGFPFGEVVPVRRVGPQK